MLFMSILSFIYLISFFTHLLTYLSFIYGLFMDYYGLLVIIINHY